jgi:translation initiation factor eIF-2B subunit epsilon
MIPSWRKLKRVSYLFLLNTDDALLKLIGFTDQKPIPAMLGKDSNALVWPRGTPDEEEDEDGIENYKNQRFMRLGLIAFAFVFVEGLHLLTPFVRQGDNASDLDFSDPGSVSSESESESSEDDFHMSLESLSATSLPLSTPTTDVPSSSAIAESEFRAEVTQSLERAFAEGHSVDNAAVELKTLRMASNVPLSRVREAVVAAIVEQIKVVEGAIPQRKEIARIVGRWGSLINKIGGVDPVGTILILQVSRSHSRVIGKLD